MAIPFLEIEASGTNRQIGHAIGEAARETIAAALGGYEEHHEAMAGFSFAAAEDRCREYLVHAARHLPQYVEELVGMAEGAGVALSKLMVVNCGEELTCKGDPMAPIGEHCTSLAIVTSWHRLVAHNEDWSALDTDKNMLLRITTADGTGIVSMAPAWSLAFTGINSHGIATAANTVYCDGTRPGVPNQFVRRWMLESRSLEEARERACLPARARGSNHLLGDAQGRIWNLETTASADALLEADDWLVHTNHYVAPEMLGFDVSTSPGSRQRLARATALLAEGLARAQDPHELAAEVLRDHDGRPLSICSHLDEDDPPGLREMTTASMIWDLDAMTVDVCAGTPCQNSYTRYGLR